MAEDFTDGNRATTALVYRTVDDLGKRVDAHFDGVKMRLDLLAPLPGRVDGLERIATDHESRLLAAERDRKRLEEVKADESSWRRTHLPALVIAALAFLASVLVPIFS